MKIAVIDLETTGLSQSQDRIVEIAIVTIDTENSDFLDYYFTRVNPGISIPEEVSKLHGITDAHVTKSPTFPEITGIVFDKINGIALSGYNVIRFDFPFLEQEFSRIGKDIPKPITIVDARDVFEKNSKYKLQDAYRYYCGKSLGEEAHSAVFDAFATKDILIKQIKEYGIDTVLPKATNQDLENLSIAELIERSAKFKIEHGLVFFNFGRFKNDSVQGHTDYLQWMIDGSFDLLEKTIAKRLIQEMEA